MDINKILTPNQLVYRLSISVAQLRALEAAYRDSGDNNQANILNEVIMVIYEARRFFAHSDDITSAENVLTPLQENI